MINTAKNQHESEASAKIRVPISDAALVRDTPQREEGERRLFRASLEQLRCLRVEALRVASQARQKMNEALLVSESYAMAALKFERRACDCEAEVATHLESTDALANEIEHCRELRSLAENHSHLASENTRRADDLSEEATSQSAKATRIAAEISQSRRQKESKTYVATYPLALVDERDGGSLPSHGSAKLYGALRNQLRGPSNSES